MKASGDQLRELTALIAAGTIRPVVDSVFDFEQTREALAHVEQGRAKAGKVVVRPPVRARAVVRRRHVLRPPARHRRHHRRRPHNGVSGRHQPLPPRRRGGCPALRAPAPRHVVPAGP
ncbi:zinc-binding dehydrogenase [Nonomuraea sp. H19]|uniref:zinc-binding dehydrogenase n=1 Tax=Nonomuraea sp. H19 TaxID=3452206 RepID=UPI003F8B0247